MQLRAALTDAELAEGFTTERDLFKRKDFALRVTGMFRQMTGGSVCMLDGRWGVGKTTFVKQWAGELSKRNIPSVYFDAFASDYLESPFEALAGSFIGAATAAERTSEPAYKTFLAKAASVGKVVAGTAAKVGIKAATLGLVGASELKSLDEIKDVLADGAGELSDDGMAALLEGHAKNASRFEQLRQAIADLPKLLQPQPNEEAAPLIVFIDELDRCRPDFSLGLIETLKHFFRAPNIHFVLVTNRSHLELSVAHRYGSGNAAREYLEKFYDFVMYFEQSKERHGDGGIGVFVRHVVDRLLPADTQDRNDLEDYVAMFSRAYSLSLRQIESFAINVGIASLAARPREFRPSILIASLCFIKLWDPDLYVLAKHGRFSMARLNALIANGQWEHEGGERLAKVFQYHADPNINAHDDEWSGWGSDLFRYNLDRMRVIPHLCNNVLDRFGAPDEVV